LDFEQGTLRPEDTLTMLGDRTRIRDCHEFPSPNEEFQSVIFISGNRQPLSEHGLEVLREAGPEGY